MAEEAAKQVGVVMLRSRIRSATDAFMVGVVTGAGFAIVEDFLYISADLRAVDWPVVVAIRALSHLLHPLLPLVVVAVAVYVMILITAKRSPGKLLTGVELIEYGSLEISRKRVFIREFLARPLAALWAAHDPNTDAFRRSRDIPFPAGRIPGIIIWY